jgi:hypothetical protein
MQACVYICIYVIYKKYINVFGILDIVSVYHDTIYENNQQDAIV